MINLEEYKNTRKGFWFKTGYVLFDVHTKNIGITPAFIYLFLKSYKNKNSGLAFPSGKFIADTLGIDRKTVVRAIKVLKNHRFIEIKKLKYKGQWVHNVYFFTQSSEWLAKPINKTENTYGANIPSPWDKNDQSQEEKSPTKEINSKKTNKKEVLLIKEPEIKIPSIRDAKPDFLKGRDDLQFTDPRLNG